MRGRRSTFDSKYMLMLNVCIHISVKLGLSRHTLVSRLENSEKILDLVRKYDMVEFIEGEPDGNSSQQTHKLVSRWEPIPNANAKDLWCILEACGSRAGLKNSEAAKRKEECSKCKELLTKVCSKWNEAVHSKVHGYGYTDAILEAIRQYADELVTILVSKLPNVIWLVNQDGHNIIQFAVINRSEKVYNLLYQLRQHQIPYKGIKDQFQNNLLHLAARLGPADKLSSISCAALQIQSELQWFKEVERFVYPVCTIQRNSDGETPAMVFTREHKALRAEAEKWMKRTARSHITAIALTITTMFAATITVSRGNNQDTGMPVSSNKAAWNILAISDAISVYTSVMSLFMFSSILTARFSEQDFLYSLPTYLIIALATLFISTTAMLVAFGATLFLMFGHNSLLTLVSIAVFTAPPVIYFLSLQLSLVYSLTRATYGRSIFGKKSKKPFC